MAPLWRLLVSHNKLSDLIRIARYPLNHPVFFAEVDLLRHPLHWILAASVHEENHRSEPGSGRGRHCNKSSVWWKRLFIQIVPKECRLFSFLPYFLHFRMVSSFDNPACQLFRVEAWFNQNETSELTDVGPISEAAFLLIHTVSSLQPSQSIRFEV